MNASRVFLVLGLLANTAIGQILLNDDFNGSAADTNLWEISLPFAQSQVSQTNGWLTTTGRGGLGTRAGFDGPIRLNTRLKDNILSEFLILTLRSDLSFHDSPQYAQYKSIAGLQVWFHQDSSRVFVQALELTNPIAPVLAEAPFTFVPGQAYDVEITDDKTNVTVSINGTLLLSFATTFSTGNKIAFQSREFSSTSTSLDFVTIAKYGVAPPSDALMYVANGQDGTVRKFTLQGQDLGFFATNGINQAYGVAVDASGDVYVACAAPNNTVRRFSSSGADMGVFASVGVSDPRAVAFDAAGNLYIVNAGNPYVRRYSAAGVDLGNFVTNTGSGNTGIAFDTNGNFYVANYFANTVRKFSPGGADLGAIITTGLTQPIGIALNSQGEFFVACDFASRLVRYNAAGVFQTNLTSGSLGRLMGVAIDRADNIYVVRTTGNAVRKFSPNGQDLGDIVTTGLNGPGFMAILQSTPAPPPTCVLPGGIVSWWRAEGNATDSVGGNHGGLMGGADFTNGLVGQAFRFNGSNNVVIPDHPSLNPTNAITVECWVKSGRLSPSWGTDLISKDGEGYSRQYFLTIGGQTPGPWYSTGGFGATIGVPGGLVGASGATFAMTNTWYHVAMTYDGAFLKLYVNGALDAQTAASGPILPTTQPVRIGGGAPDGAPPYYFDGLIDEPTIYNRALASNEIAAIYQAGSAGKCPPPEPPPVCNLPDGIVSWWKGESNSLDRIGTNHAEVVGSVSYVPGKVGTGFRFNGAGSHLRVPHNQMLNFSNALSVDLWFKNEGPATGYGLIAKRGTASGLCNFGVNILNAGTGAYYNDPAVAFAGDDNSDYEVCRASQIPSTNEFHHFAATWRQASSNQVEVQVFLDGQLLRNRLIAGSLARTWSEAPVTIGISTPTGEYFKGVMDEVSLYNRVLSSNEVAAIYAAGEAGKCTPPLPCQLPPGLAGWWKLEGNGLDVVGTNVGTLFGSPLFSAGKVGQSLVFDGINDHVKVAASPSLDVGAGTGMTIETWINPASLATQQPLVEWSDGLGSGVGAHFWISVAQRGGGPGSLWANFLDVNHVSHEMSSAPGLLVTNVYQHVAMTYDKASGAAGLYVNGSLVALTNLGSFTPNTRSDMYMGLRPSGGAAGTRYRGTMDEVSIYNRALGTNEIATIFNLGSAGKCVPPATAPAITQQPVGQTAIVGDLVTFAPGVTGTGPLIYQWRFAGNPIPGATNAVLYLYDVQLANAGNYSVTVSNSAGTVTSADALLTVLIPQCAPAPNGLAGWWKLENNGLDVIGTNVGTLFGSPLFSAGKVGQSMVFDGINDHVKVAASPSVNIGAGTGMTIETWINPASLTTQQPLVEWSDGLGPAGVGAHFWISVAQLGGGPGSLWANFLDVNHVSHEISSAPGLLVTNVYQHVAMTYDKASGAAGLYVNGSLVAQTNLGSFTPDTRPDMYVGLRPSGGGAGTRYRGAMDEVSIYNRALGTNEIAAIYAARGEGKCPVPPKILSVIPSSALVNEGGKVTFTATAAGSPPLTYQWQFNAGDIGGATNATLSLSNVVFAQGGNYTLVVSGPGGVVSSNVVLAVNRAPIADAGATEKLLISPNGSNAVAVLDGSLSSDPDGALLSYAWFRTGEASSFAAGVVAITSLPLGTNQLTLVVNDGMATGSNTFAVEVISTLQAVDRLQQLVIDEAQNPQPLVASLRAALASIDRSQPETAINQLEAFKNKVLAQVMPIDPDLANTLLADAQAIIDALSGGPVLETVALEITSIESGNSGKPKLNIRGQGHRTCVVEASSDMVNWTAVGVAKKSGDTAFEFEDTQASPSAVLYYRVVSPK